jgi:hypothetical protein
MKNTGRLQWGNLSKELKLLLFMIGQEENEFTSPIHEELFQDIDWKHFLELTNHHRVFSLVYRKIKAMDKLPVPDQVEKKLHQEYKLNTFEMLNISGEMLHLSNQLTKASVPCLFLKGPILAMELYGDLSLRSSCDLDVLIPLKDLNRAENLLLDQGYVKDDYFPTTLNDWKWRHHHVTFTHPQRKVKVELHWRFNPGPSIEPSFDQLWQRKRKSPFNNIHIPVYFLGKEDLFMFLLSHGARHGWSRLRWLVDIDRFSKQALDWKLLHSLLREFGTSHVAGQAFILCAELLKTPLTDEMLSLTENRHTKKLAEDTLFYLKQMVNLHSQPLPVDVAKYHKHHLFALMGTRHKLLFMISFLHPYPIDAETLPLPKRLHFLYFPLRPFLWMWRISRKHVKPNERVE